MQHNLMLENRQSLKVTAVVDVESFDEEKIMLITEEDGLIIEGEDLHIQKLSVDDGELSITGEILSITYTDKLSGKKSSGGFFTKMFK